jgi:hypothetical protein
MLNLVETYLKTANYIVIIILMVVVAVVAFSMGNCGGEDKYDKFLKEYKTFKEQAELTKKYGDSLRVEVDKLQDSIQIKDTHIGKLNVVVVKNNTERKKLSNKLSYLESELDSLKNTGDSSAIIVTQDSIIVNLKDQIKTADNTITYKDSIITATTEKFELTDTQKKLYKKEADSLRIIVSNIPKPPKKDKFLGFIPKPNRYVISAVSFGTGVVVGSKLSR